MAAGNGGFIVQTPATAIIMVAKQNKPENKNIYTGGWVVVHLVVRTHHSAQGPGLSLYQSTAAEEMLHKE